MKELNPENWIYWFALITIACMLLPIVAVLVRQQFSRSFIAIVVYFLFTFLYNLLFLFFPNFPKEISRYVGVANNFLDTPLVLLFLQHLCYNEKVKKVLSISIISFITFETIVIIAYGFSVRSISIFEGPGIILILAFAFHFFAKYMKLAFAQKSEIPKTLMVSGILFAYCVYFLVYLFYYVLKTPHKMDALIVYLFASLTASILIGVGLLTIKKDTYSQKSFYQRSFSSRPSY